MGVASGPGTGFQKVGTYEQVLQNRETLLASSQEYHSTHKEERETLHVTTRTPVWGVLSNLILLHTEH